MYPSTPFLKTAVTNTVILVKGSSTRLFELEGQNPNTVQAFIQIFDAVQVSDVKNNVTFTADNTSSTFTSNGHGLKNNWPIKLFSTLNMPTGLTQDTKYFVVGVTTNTFQIAVNPGGAAVAFTDNGTGTLTFFTFFERSILVPPGDGINSGAVSKEWNDGLILKNGLCICATSTLTGSTAPTSKLIVEGSHA